MAGAMQYLTELTARLLTREEREVVLGDIQEMGIAGWRGLWEMLGLCCRRQLQLWSGWQPWAAAFLLSLPFSFLLMGFSVAISMGFREALSSTGGLHGSWFFVRLLCQIVLLLACSWAGGFVTRVLAPRVFWLSTFLCLFPCLFCFLRFRIPGLSHLCVLLFLLPAIAGVYSAMRGMKPNRRGLFGVALLCTFCMAGLTVTLSLWIFNWLLLWPLWILAAGAWNQRRVVEQR